ncbi:hypothetical protein Leryth_025233 [Lithospermum erythrorhizon]|nr:hypothetical protein Leryth_025233 [Lithospermum erythrorhizon]
MSTTTTAFQILHQTRTYFTTIIIQPPLRHHLISTFLKNTPPDHELILNTITIAAQTLEHALSTSTTSLKFSSLRLAENLLLPYSDNPFSCFLLSIIYHVSDRPTEATVKLLDVFYLKPSLSRMEIAVSVFEELFLVHFYPVFEWYNEERLKILSNLEGSSGYQSDEELVVVSGTRRLSNMSGDQASELKCLEREFKKLLDENCRNFAGYFKEVLRDKETVGLLNPPKVVLQNHEIYDEFECERDENEKEDFQLQNGRFNPMWADEERSMEENNSKNKTVKKYPSFVPERVSSKVFREIILANKADTSHAEQSDCEVDSCSGDNMSEISSWEYVHGNKEKNKKFESSYSNIAGSSCNIESPDPAMEDVDNQPVAGKHTPPKDFVCPITSNLFDDPVTLETGQTYERKAIQEWVERGNSTCPITRQRLQSDQLPKTNYVLKRLIASWKEQNLGSVVTQSEREESANKHKLNSKMHLVSASNVSHLSTTDHTVNDLRTAITELCTSEILEESEAAVLQIESFWREEPIGVEIQNMLSKPPVISAFVEILFNSVDVRILKATVILLSELIIRDNTIIQTLTRVDSDMDCIVVLFKNGLLEAVVLIYLLQPSIKSLVDVNMVDCILQVLRDNEDDSLKMTINPKTASVQLLRLVIGSSDGKTSSKIARRVVSSQATKSIIFYLQSDVLEEKIAAVGILLRCILADGASRNVIADKIQLAPIVESFIEANDEQRFEIVHFLFQLVKMKRRRLNEQILHIIKDEGIGSTMHTLLIYLQTALQEQCPIVAGLLLQLDLLAEPRKMSIYREEAIDTLISCLRNSEFPTGQLAAAETIVSLQGRFSSSGKPLMRAYLLKCAGLGKKYETMMRKANIQDIKEEDEAAEDWDRKMASVLVSHEFGLLFEALSEGLKSRYVDLCSLCFVSATWLVHSLSSLPDTGVRGAARLCLLNFFVTIFKSAKNTEDRALSMLALRSFIRDSEGLDELTIHIKDILKGLRELKKTTSEAFEMLKVLSEEQENSSQEFWNHKEIEQVDCTENGEVLSIVFFKDRFFSGHSDGTIKVWSMTENSLHLVQETREHSKAVRSLKVFQSTGRLYSGSLDKTERVWSLDNDMMHCDQVHEMKDHVNNLVVTDNFSCFVPQGTGVKVHSWNGESRLLNPNKQVRCLAFHNEKLYCGCQDNSIQVIDLPIGTPRTIQSGTRKILGKAIPVYSLEVHEGLLYAAGASMDGASVKIWNTSDETMVGSLPSTLEIRSMAIGAELIYLGGKGGLVEIWCKKKHTKVELLQTGTTCKVNCISFDINEDILVIGTSDGKIQVWGMN